MEPLREDIRGVKETLKENAEARDLIQFAQPAQPQIQPNLLDGQLPQGLAQPTLAPQAPAQGGIDLYERFGITDEDRAYYAANDFQDLNGVAMNNDQRSIHEYMRKHTMHSNKLGNQIGGLKRRKRLTREGREMLEGLQLEQASLKKYVDVLKRISTGSGLIPIGDYTAPRKRLARDNILSVRYAKNPAKMVPSLGATRVSNPVKQVLLKPNSKIPQLTAGEKQFLNKLYMNSGQKMQPSQAAAIRGSGVFTSLKEIGERAQVLLGEMKAGNTSINLKNELSDLLHYLYKHRQIKKGDYTNLINAISI